MVIISWFIYNGVIYNECSGFKTDGMIGDPMPSLCHGHCVPSYVVSSLWSISALHCIFAGPWSVLLNVCLRMFVWGGHFSSVRQEKRSGQDEFLNVRCTTDRWLGSSAFF